MAKLKISDYSSTSAGANLNTDINSINIDEGCAPSGINDALRTLMAQLKDFQTGVTGDSLTLGGALSGTSATFSGDLTVDTNTLYVDSTNNRVGIGTSSPNYHMTINGGASATSIQLANTATGTGPANGLLIYQDGVNSRIQNIEAGVLTLWTSNTERMRIDSSGNVGIGASSPSTKLDVTSATSSVAKFTTGAVSSVMYNSTGSGTSYWGDPTVANSFAVNAGSNYVSAWTNNTERMRIDSSGNLLLGTTSRAFNSTNYGITIPPNGETFWVTDTPGNIIAFNRNSDGSVFKFFRSGGQVGAVSVTSTNTTYGTTSDYRLKENVAPMSGSIDRLKQLKPSTWSWINGGNGEGFIAHEAQTVIPEAVTGEKDAMRTEEYEVTPAVTDDEGNVTTAAVMGTREVPDYQAIDQSKLVPLLTAALQEAITKIENLETRIQALESA